MSGPAGLVVGAITVLGDATYTCVPPANGYLVPATASSLAQALFEQRVFNVIKSDAALLAFPLTSQTTIVDATTSPPTTAAAKTMQGIAVNSVSDADAIVGYIQANGLITVTVPAAGLKDSGGGSCTGSGTGTGTIS